LPALAARNVSIRSWTHLYQGVFVDAILTKMEKIGEF